MNLTEWMRANLSPEVVADNENPALGIRLREVLAAVLAAGEVDGPERTVLALSQPQARSLVGLLAVAWEDGARNGSRGLLPEAEREERNPFSAKPDDAIDDQRHRHLLPEAFCEWCGELDLLGRHTNGCRLGLGPDELDEVDYECPRCMTVAPWTDGIENAPEFWCQTCGAETPLADCRAVPR